MSPEWRWKRWCAAADAPPKLLQRYPEEGAWLLRDYPGDTVRVDCPKCDRAGSYGLAALITCYGPRAGLPDLLSLLAADCPRRGALGQFGEPCSAGFPDLASAVEARLIPRPREHDSPGIELNRSRDEGSGSGAE